MNPIEKTILSFDWMTLVLFGGLILLALGKYLDHSKFLNFLILPFNDKYVLFQSKKGQLFDWFQLLLTIFQILNLSLFILIMLHVLGLLENEMEAQTYFIVFGFLLLFEFSKFILQMFTGFVFNNTKFIGGIIFNKISYLNFSSLVVALANIFLVYILKDSKTIIYGTLFLIIAINGIGILKLLKNHQNTLFPYFVYFILYLCTLEIAPLVLIGSFIKG
ncbi:DUF4271 domain-containing protein [Flagellimonas zhangzhouensis]|uniref:DUF4271 domain-containing protein n=1 Tax=Flagellimonas zhangzhouensis TaxID=1073328 RepID=A0A1H2VFD7_9FLAO|nr:DUF4271 domain-containing protein [Allomuricauda zhangzhouensis]SDQ08212.1 protein of unknown function [Allomuricauda zhangzhouensis]SDW67066.1 protein of unknown function [Allomuricauda zhangzhouensis]